MSMANIVNRWKSVEVTKVSSPRRVDFKF